MSQQEDVRSHERIIFSLDTRDLGEATEIAEELSGHVGLFKVGLELQQVMLAMLRGPDPAQVVEAAHVISAFFQVVNGRLMWDGKYTDIPATMGGAAGSTAIYPPQFFTVHASMPGIAGMKAALEACGDAKMLAVTVLTSMNDDECKSIFGDYSLAKVQQFAYMAREAGAHGLVCSAQELNELVLPPGVAPDIKVIPGIRPQWAAKNDQSRVTTPADAIRMGADYLVIGRPIRTPPNGMTRCEAASRIADEIATTIAALSY